MLVVGSGTMWAEDKTNVSTVSTKFSATGDVTSNFTQTGNFTPVNWNLDVTWKTSTKIYWGNLEAKGSQIGSGSAPASTVVLTGTDVPGTIKSVKVNTSVASGGNTTVSVSVGGTTFKCSNSETATLQTSAADYDFTGSGSGNVVITWNQPSTSKAIYIKSVTITYEEQSTPTGPSISANDASVSWDAEGGNIEYTISNPVEGGFVTATEWDTEATWLQFSGNGSGNKLPFTVSTNYGGERSANVTLKYTYVIDEKVYDASTTVTVTQGAKPAPVIIVDQDSYTIGKDQTSIEIPYTIQYPNPNTNPALAFEGNTEWTTLGRVFDYDNNKVTITTDANNTPERTVNVVFKYDGAADKTVTLTQEGVIWPTVSFRANPAEGADGFLCINTSDNSKQLTSGDMVKPGDWIAISVTPAGNNYEFANWTEANNKLEIANPTETTISFQMPEEDVEIVANFNAPSIEWVKTSISDLTANDVFVIVGNNADNYAMSNDQGTGSAPTAVGGVTISGDKITSAVADNIQWNISSDTNGYTFYPKGSTTTWLYCTNSNNGVRVGTNTDKVFTISEEGYLYNTATSRYVGIYNSQDWRCYTSINANIKDQTFAFYKKVSTAPDERAEAGLSYDQNEVQIELKDGTYDAIYNTSNPLNNPNSLTGFTWTSSDESVATVNQSGEVTLKSVGSTTITASFEGNDNYKPGEASFTLQVVDYRQESTVTWQDANNETITDLNVEKGDYIQGITLSCDVEGFTFTEANLQYVWGTNETHDNWEGAMPAGYIIGGNAVWTSAVGTITVTATFPGNDTYKPASAALTITVTGGTETSPYSVAEARAAIDANTGVTGVYAKGIVSEIMTPYNSQYGNITYNISDDGKTTSDQLQAFRGKSYGGNDFTSEDDIQVGDVVIITGNLIKYGETYEFAKDNELVFNQPRLIVADGDKTVTVNAAGQITNHDAQTITINYRNFLTAAPSAANVSVLYCDVNGTVAADSYDWIKSISFNEAGNGFFTMSCLFEANTGEARTGYAKVQITIDNVIYSSDIITITQNAPVASHNVTFSVNGTVTEPVSVKEGAAITFPEVSDKDGMTFIGWTDQDEIHGTTDVRPNIVTSATMGTENIEYRAVFAFAISNGGSYTLDYSAEADLSSSTEWGSYGTAYEYTATDGSTWTVKAYKNAGMQINSGKNASINVPGCPENITSIVVTCSAAKAVGFSASDYEGSGTITYLAEGTDAKTQTLDLSKESVKTGYIVPKGGNTSITKIVVNYGSTIYSDYCTTIPEMLTVTIAEACTDGKGKFYGTYSSSSAFKVPANVTVSEIGINNDGTMDVQSYAAGAIVPANTGVMVSAETYGDFKLIKSEEKGTSVLENNRLRPTGVNGITADGMNDANADMAYKFYRLTMHNGTKLGFWWGAENGAAFAVAANKAYLAIPASVAGARSGFAFGDDVTGISQIENGKLKIENYYDLQGRKVSKPVKGLYIVNGKKVVIK